MKLDCKPTDFVFPPNGKPDLSKWPTNIDRFYDSKQDYHNHLEEFKGELSDLQRVLYAHNRHAVLLVFQGMDASGKDGAIRHVMSGVNPQGCQVFSFKQPSSEELDHDFLWRCQKRLPERGRIGIFNRSYYEEVLVVRVVPSVLASQRIPAERINPKTIWKERFADIRQMEDYLYRNGTRVLKFFLHLSKEEQRQRFLSRIDDKSKNWKLTPEDIEMRELWDKYQHAYADCLAHTSTKHAPWHVIPADDKRNARLIISHIIVEAMKSIDMDYPKATQEHRQKLQRIREKLDS